MAFGGGEEGELMAEIVETRFQSFHVQASRRVNRARALEVSRCTLIRLVPVRDQ